MPSKLHMSASASASSLLTCHDLPFAQGLAEYAGRNVNDVEASAAADNKTHKASATACKDLYVFHTVLAGILK